MKHQFKKTYSCRFIVNGLLLSACCSLPALAAPSESKVIETLAIKGLDTHFVQLIDSAKVLDNRIKTLCTSATQQNLAFAQKSWHKAYLAWRESLPFLITSADKLELKVGKPINDIVLNAVVSSAEFSMMRKDNDVRGYAGIEYLLFTPETAKQAVADFRCEHLTDLSQEIINESSIAKEAWQTKYREPLILAGNGEPYLMASDALSLIVAKWLNTTEVMLREDVLVPSSSFDNKAKPELLDAPYSRSTLAGFKATIAGLEIMLVADEKNSLLNLVATKDGLRHKKDPQLAKDIVKQITKLKSILADIEHDNTDAFTALTNDEDSLESFYQELNQLQTLVVEAVQVLELDIRAGLEAKLMKA